MSGSSQMVQPVVLCCKKRAGPADWRNHWYECLRAGSQLRVGVAPGTPRLAWSRAGAKFLAAACPSVYHQRGSAASALLPPSARCTCTVMSAACASIANNPFHAAAACTSYQSGGDTLPRVAHLLPRALPAMGKEPQAGIAFPPDFSDPAGRTPAAVQDDPICRLTTNSPGRMQPPGRSQAFRGLGGLDECVQPRLRRGVRRSAPVRARLGPSSPGRDDEGIGLYRRGCMSHDRA